MTSHRTVGVIVLVVLTTASVALLSAPAMALPVTTAGSSGAVDQPAHADSEAASIAVDGDIRAVATMGTPLAAEEGDERHTSARLDEGAAARVTVDPADRPALGPEVHRHGTSPKAIGTAGSAVTGDMDRTGYAIGPNGDYGVDARYAPFQPTGSLGAEGEASQHDAFTGDAPVDVRGERYERPWGLAPGTIVSPATMGGVAFGFLLGAGAYAVARPNSRRTRKLDLGDAPQEAADSPESGASDEDDLIPDEAVVEGMLLRQDGRMRQSAIVNMTDWSKAKVSRLLTAMAEEGRVVKVRIGRENLICLHGWEPDALKGPHPV